MSRCGYYRESFFVDVVLPVATIILIVALVMFGAFSLAEGSAHDDCHTKGEIAQVQVTYRQWDGCYVNYNGLWMPFDVWQYNREHGLLK